MRIELGGRWHVKIDRDEVYEVALPGTLDENEIGYPDNGGNRWHPDEELGNTKGIFRSEQGITTRFTRRFRYEGEAVFWRTFNLRYPADRRVFLKAERARCLRLLVDGQEVPAYLPASISTPHIFEVTEQVAGKSGVHTLTLISDNHYPGLPHDDIIFSSAATDETQTNWNGILGEFCLWDEEQVFLDELRVYPAEHTVTVCAVIDATRAFTGELQLSCEAFAGSDKGIIRRQVSVRPGRTTIRVGDIALAKNAKRWDLEEGILYTLRAGLTESGVKPGRISGIPDGEQASESPRKTESGVKADRMSGIQQGESASRNRCKTVRFGLRTFGDDGEGHLALNGRRVFLRGETNCAVFPETGYCPMDVDSWREILSCYRSYGINFVRFHSHCPPEAAFTAADELGMLLMPELSHWNPRDAFETDESLLYYRNELERILLTLADHPSFVMLTLGNELHASEKGLERMHTLLDLARRLDSTRLYANGANVFYGERGCDAGSDFYTAVAFRDKDLRGTSSLMTGFLNQQYPSACHDHTAAMAELREEYAGPVFGFEVGQYEVLPDLGEIDRFRGITDPVNLKLIREQVRERGLQDNWDRYVEATGELSLRCYREEVEAALRTEELSGLALLGLQDFPGQGTALVGMLNSHLEAKPYPFAAPERFRAFCKDVLPLALMNKYTYEAGEELCARVRLANYGKHTLEGELWGELREASSGGGQERRILKKICINAHVRCEAGGLTDAGELQADLEDVFFAEPRALTLRVVLVRRGCGAAWQIGQIEQSGQTRKISLKEQSGQMAQMEQMGWIDVEGGRNWEDHVAASEDILADNSYSLWFYPRVRPVCPADVYECRWLDERALEILARGGKVYLAPPSTSEALPRSIQGQFSTDFWSVGVFAGQAGGMGQLIEQEHPIFRHFPTASHTDWQWWPMASQRAAILPKAYHSIITEMDSFAYLRPMTQLLECRCGSGRLLFSTLGLQDLQAYPEARALQDAIYRYLASDDFAPGQEIGPEVFAELVRPAC